MEGLRIDSEKCGGGGICEMAYKMGHLGLFNPRKALLRVEIDPLPNVETNTSENDKDDTFPFRSLFEPMPEDPSKGNVVPFKEMLPEYDALRGWDGQKSQLWKH